MNPPPRLAALEAKTISNALKAPGGLRIPYGACTVRVRAFVDGFADALRNVYGAFPFLTDDGFDDFHLVIDRGRGARRWVRPTARFLIDGVEPFEPFPRSNALPYFEWGVNWCFAQRFNQYVLLHAGVLAIGDRAVVMAATPGSGKSTLAAGMMLSGFRLLSDEFGVLDPVSGDLLSMLKPVALKNESIEVIRALSDEAALGPIYRGTRKGDVSHLAPNANSVEQLGARARPVLVVFPRYRRGVGLELKPQLPEEAFARLAFNSFNYSLLGPVSFDALAVLAGRCQVYELTYGDLPKAIGCVRALLNSNGEGGGAREY